ncbi:MAG TPA: hypothetical protein PKK06_11405 [Phycisphaerae bacterium]|nr:hypothetical protein [Phycisphaerae bacterium]HNU45847.1 hypothetical protein [Phycisphaerae bacterium]
MLMKTMYYMFVTNLTLWAPVALQSAEAQEEPRPPSEVAVVRLNHLQTFEALNLVEEIYAGELDALTAAEATGQLVLRGEPKVVQAVRDLLQQVDQPPAERSARRTRLLPVGSYPLEEMAKIVLNSFGGEQVRVAPDMLNRQLAISAPPAVLDDIAGLVGELDLPTQTLTAQFFFISGRIDPAAKPEGSKLPEALAPVARTLSASGLADLTQARMILVRSALGEQFRQRGEVQGGAGESFTTSRFEVQGHLGGRGDSEQVELQLSANAEMFGQLRQGNAVAAQGNLGEFRLETTLAVKCGEYVILGAAPASTDRGDAIALVVRIVRD